MTPGERTTLARLADILVPAAHGMPSASEVGVHERWLDRVLAARPDLAEPLTDIVRDATGQDPEKAVGRLRDANGERFSLLLSVVTAAYYLSPRVRRLAGYPGQRPNEVFVDQAEHDLRESILDPVIARGPIWRQAPG